MTLKTFDLGIITRTHPHIIPSEASIKYVNCDNETSSLCPTKLPVLTDLVAKDKWVHNLSCDTIASSNNEAYWTTSEDLLYTIETEKLPLSVVECDNTFTKVGILAPAKAATYSLSGAGELCGTYEYVYTYYNGTYESAPSAVVEAVTIEPEELQEVVGASSEQLDFLSMGEYIYSIYDSELDGLLTSIEYKIEAVICAVNKYTYTTTRLVEFVSQANSIYIGIGSATEKYDLILCLLRNYPESFSYNSSFKGMYIYLNKLVNNDDYNKQYIIDSTSCVLDGYAHAVDSNNAVYKELIDKLVVAIEEPYGDSYLTEESWRWLQLRCIASEEAIEDVAEEVIEEVCGGAISVEVYAATEHVDGIRLYRLGGDLTTYTLVTELPNITSIYLDTSSDAAIAGNHILDSFNNIPAPEDGRFLIEYNVMLFLATSSSLRFSDIARPEAWPLTNELRFPADITGIGVVQNGLLVFTRYKTYIVVGNSPSTLAKYLISDEQGCINHNTIAFNNNSLFWLSTDGVCSSSGGEVAILTQERLSRLVIDDSINAVVYDRMYILSYSGGCLILDNRYKFCIRYITDTGWLGVYKDKLHIAKEGNLLDMFSGESAEMDYISPVFSEGRLSEYKIFKDIYIAFTGEVHVTIFLYTHNREREVIFDRALDTNHIQTDLKTKGNRMGYGIQFQITGTGCVQEIDFKASTGRENGK